MKKHTAALEQKLEQRRAEGLYRSLQKYPQEIDFFSNDYLGLAAKSLVQYMQPLQKHGSTGSRLISGNSEAHEALEKRLALFFKGDSALLFNSGYDANVGFFSSVPRRNDTVIYDEYAHASIRDGIRLGLAKNYSFKHNNIPHLTTLLGKAEGNVYVAVESVYSMDGDLAPVKKLADLCEIYGAALVVDEAHATGVLGEQGEGFVVSQHLQDKTFARIHTFGKALGSHGATVICNTTVKNFLINYAHAFIYTTTLPPQTVNRINAVLQFLGENRDLIEVLQSRITTFNQMVAGRGVQVLDNLSPIKTIILGSNAAALNLAEYLQKEDYAVKAILSPTVPKGKERLRISLHTFNTAEEMEGLLQHIVKFLSNAK